MVKLFCFFAGPEHPWLVSMYGKHALHPFGSVVGEEIFQSGIVPGATDFRIYRDYGGLPGKLFCLHKLIIHCIPKRAPPSCDDNFIKS